MSDFSDEYYEYLEDEYGDIREAVRHILCVLLVRYCGPVMAIEAWDGSFHEWQREREAQIREEELERHLESSAYKRAALPPCMGRKPK